MATQVVPTDPEGGRPNVLIELNSRRPASMENVRRDVVRVLRERGQQEDPPVTLAVNEQTAVTIACLFRSDRRTGKVFDALLRDGCADSEALLEAAHAEKDLANLPDQHLLQCFITWVGAKVARAEASRPGPVGPSIAALLRGARPVHRVLSTAAVPAATVVPAATAGADPVLPAAVAAAGGPAAQETADAAHQGRPTVAGGDSDDVGDSRRVPVTDPVEPAVVPPAPPSRWPARLEGRSISGPPSPRPSPPPGRTDETDALTGGRGGVVVNAPRVTLREVARQLRRHAGAVAGGGAAGAALVTRELMEMADQLDGGLGPSAHQGCADEYRRTADCRECLAVLVEEARAIPSRFTTTLAPASRPAAPGIVTPRAV